MISLKTCPFQGKIQDVMPGYKVGDKIVENGRVYKIFKIENGSEQDEVTIYFRPVFDEGTGLIGSIPVENIDDGEFRDPATVSEVNSTLKVLSKKGPSELRVDTDEMDDKLKENDIQASAQVANLLWIDKKNEDTSFSPTKRRLFKKAIRTVSEEYANAKDTSLEKAEEKIRSYLNKAL